MPNRTGTKGRRPGAVGHRARLNHGRQVKDGVEHPLPKKASPKARTVVKHRRQRTRPPR